MGVTGISGKTSLPLLPTAYQARDRLRPLGPRLEHSRLVVVEAAAGYGKTTLLAANVRDSRRHLFWYTFDNLDVDLRSFCQNLAGWLGIEGADAGLDAGTSSAHLSQMLLAELLGRLQSTEEGWNVVFDDLHAVRSLPEVLSFIDDLARLLPAGCTLYLASREPVGVHIAKLRALGQVAIVKERDLQFTRQETASLFRAALPDLTVHPRDLDRLAAKTEGWAAGLGICLRFLEAMPGRSLKQALSRLDSTGPDWFSYFAEEVLQTLDRPLQAFLLRASLLPRLEPDLCKRVLGINDSREMLETLDRRNLFTFPVSEERTSYRFHQLFHDFLGRQLAQKVPAEEICRLRRRAARQLASEAAWLEAAEIYSTNGDSAAALALLEKHGKEVLGEGHSGRLLRILESLPPRSFAGRPGALAVLGQAHDVQGHWDEAMTLYARALRLRPPAFARAELMVMMARIYNLRGDYARCSRMCHQALATPGWRHRPTWTRAHGLLGTSAAETGKFAEAEDHYRRAAVVLAKGNDLPGQAYLHYLMAINVHAPRGEFSAAKEAGRRALRLCRRIRDRRGIIYSLGVLGFVTVAAGEEVEARDLAEDALHQAEVEGNRSFAGFCQVVLGRCALLRGDLTDAETHFQNARRAGEPLGDTDLRTYPQLGLAEVALARGNRHSARSAAIEALQSARQTHDPLQEAQAETVLGLTCSDAETARARVWWRHSERTLRAIGARYELHRLLLLRLQAGDVPVALVPAVLQELLTGVARMHHEPLLLVVERARGAEVLETALRLGVERDFAGSLLGRLGDEAVPALERLSREPGLADLCVCLLGQIGGDAALQALSHLRDATTKTGRAALRAWEDLSSSPEDPLRIAALGPLRISVGERDLTTGAWQSKRALLLFLILLLRRFRWVPTDEIIEALWPGVDADKGRNNLVQSVHLLRRTLQPGLRQARLSRYVLSRQDACRLEPGRGFVYDVQQFEEALACAQKEERAGHPDRAEKCLRQAIELYQGDLLEERPYEEILAEERERMRERMLGAVARLLDLLAGSRRWGDVLPLCTLGLAKDPCREGFHAYLIQARLAGGDRSGALEGYHRYEKIVRRELGVAPSVRMQALARRITEAQPKGT